MRTEKVFAVLNRYSIFDIASEYAEPGYSKDHPDKPIIFSNWNNVPDHVTKYVEKRFNTEWQDEWIINNDKAYRTSPDSYDWKKYYMIDEDGTFYGGDEVEEDEALQEWYVEEVLLNSPNRICLFKIDLAKLGFEQMAEVYENGLHQGMNDDPRRIMIEMQEKYPDYDFVFGNFDPSQFYIEFRLWRRPKSEAV